MDLRDRLAQNRSGAAETGPDPMAELRARVHTALIEELGPQLLDSSAEAPEELRIRVRADIRGRLAAERGLSVAERDTLLEDLTDDVLGNGPIERLLADDTITEVMINGPHDVWIERAGRISRSSVRFADDDHLRRIINKIVNQIGRRVDESSPMVDARLPDGSRVNAVLPPVSLSGPLMTIRKFGRDRLTMSDMVRLGTLTDEAVEFLDACLHAKLNVLISGGTGSGKTTMLNALSASIPDSERIVTIEDAAELKLDQAHVLRLEARPPNIEGEGEIRIRDLVRNSLRMRPDRIIVGEVRGAEALDMLQAMNTGHDGSLCTVHANSTRDALARIETMVLMAGFDLPVKAIRQQVASALDLIVHLDRLPDGARRVMAVTEVLRMEGDIVTLQDLFTYDVHAGGATIASKGGLRPTGLRPAFLHKFELRDVTPPVSVAGPAAFGAPMPRSLRG
ncbi:CpaF family protein [Paraconexibacter antarcticus]|uniref:CpaF family protein n=1 Tax=Paraconexibacter antarcticus TaxID=2949664 RepID=A0ABY5DZ63_9ACTN|nr:CpaF family protein [Paraconexibacter antarcticus]UTI65895.1 CpaF family protein [Paraconexibacter antarcticus]